MNKSITIPAKVKADLLEIAGRAKYVQVLEILSRGELDEVIIHDTAEAQSLMNVARVELLDALLKYPYWDDTRQPYDAEHEDAFQEVQMGLFEKLASYLGQEFELETRV